MELPNLYTGDYKKLAIIPLLLVLIGLYFITQIEPGLEFKGGVLVTLELSKQMSEQELGSLLSEMGFKDFNVRTYSLGESHIAEIEIAHTSEIVALEKTYTNFLDTYDKYSKKEYELLVLKGSNASTSIQEKELEELSARLLVLRKELADTASVVMGRQVVLPENIDKLKPAVEELFSDATLVYRNNIMSQISKKISYKSYSFKLINPSLSTIFIGKIEGVMLAAAVLSAVTVFFIFRSFIPSVAVLTGATSDIIFALGFMGIMHIPLSLAAIAAILMLIGFSLDTDILLTVRILKKGLKDPRASAYSAMKTGITMSLSAILAFFALFIVGEITNITVYQVISQVVIAGLIGDLIATWMLNAVIMIYYAEHVKMAGRHGFA
ncbi:MAG: hypothetical protein ACP5H8_03615 [Candidatus Micrarchaeia archaeon]